MRLDPKQTPIEQTAFFDDLVPPAIVFYFYFFQFLLFIWHVRAVHVCVLIVQEQVSKALQAEIDVAAIPGNALFSGFHFLL